MTIPEAAELAKAKLIEVMPELSQGNLRLEELEAPAQSSTWRFTFSAVFPYPDDPDKSAVFLELIRGRRVAKSVEIEAGDGSLVAIRNAA